jgi:hypothetical protein
MFKIINNNIMKKKILFVLLSLFLVSSFTFADDSLKTIKEFRKINQKAFTIGEKLNFEINYGFVTAGTAVLEILPEYQVINGKNCFDVNASVNSNTSFEWVYKFTERFRSLIDADGIFPWRFEQTINEPNYSKIYEANFDQENLKVKIASTVKGDKKPDEEYNIQQYVHDIISAFYFARTFDFSGSKEGDLYYIPYFHKNSTVSLPVKFLGRETADVSAGEFKCIMLQPNVKEGDVASKADDIVVWVTDDAIKMPVMVKVNIIIGAVKVELTKYSGLAGPLTSKVN